MSIFETTSTLVLILGAYDLGRSLWTVLDVKSTPWKSHKYTYSTYNYVQVRKLNWLRGRDAECFPNLGLPTLLPTLIAHFLVLQKTTKRLEVARLVILVNSTSWHINGDGELIGTWVKGMGKDSFLVPKVRSSGSWLVLTSYCWLKGFRGYQGTGDLFSCGWWIRLYISSKSVIEICSYIVGSWATAQDVYLSWTDYTAGLKGLVWKPQTAKLICNNTTNQKELEPEIYSIS